MGKRGFPKKPQLLKVLSGKSKILQSATSDLNNIDEFNVAPPDDFNGQHLEVWKKTVELLRVRGMIRDVDYSIIEAFCCSYVLWKKAEKELANQESLTGATSIFVANGSKTEFVQNPLLLVCCKLRSETVAFAAQMGMTPSARLRLEDSVVRTADKKVNLFEKIKNSVDK